jgi:Holliday junction resolvase RusA-like endonuclease
MGASKKYRAWETRARQAAEQQLQSMGITEPTAHEFKLEVKAFMKGNLMDLDAVHTAVMDCLEGIVWINDRQVKRYSDKSGVWRDTRYPRTEVTFSVIAYTVEDVARRLG